MTSNGFDFFEGARTETKAPQITVRRSGQMVLTSAAVALLGDGVTHVQFGFDTKTGAVALRAATEETKGHYRLREQANGSSLVDGRRFLGHHGLKLDKAQRFPAEAFGRLCRTGPGASPFVACVPPVIHGVNNRLSKLTPVAG